jgi:hypothetical protein
VLITLSYDEKLEESLKEKQQKLGLQIMNKLQEPIPLVRVNIGLPIFGLRPKMS